GAGPPPLEALDARDVLRLLQLSRVHAQVPVGRAHEGLQLVEGEGVGGGQRAHDAEPHAVVDEVVEVGRLAPPRRAADAREPPARGGGRGGGRGTGALLARGASGPPRSAQPPCRAPMKAPNATWSTPKPAMSRPSPQRTGPRKAMAPRAMNANPMAGTARTEN